MLLECHCYYVFCIHTSEPVGPISYLFIQFIHSYEFLNRSFYPLTLFTLIVKFKMIIVTKMKMPVIVVNLVSISSTFYEQLLCQYICSKKLQIQNVTREKLRKALSYENFSRKMLMKLNLGNDLIKLLMTYLGV